MRAAGDPQIIAANSPQAKGRVERNNGVHQDRLVKKLRRKGIQDYQARMRIWRRNIFLSTTDDLRGSGRGTRGLPPSRAARCRTGPSFPARERNARLAKTGWCATTTGFFSSSRRVAITRRAQGKVLVCEGRYGNIAIEYRGRALRGKEIPAPRKPSGRGQAGQSASSADGQERSGCRQRITRGERRLAERWRSACPRRPSQPGRCWPGPPLRPKRSALRAPQDCAPDQANRAAKNRGCCRSTEIGIVVPRTP